MNHRHVVDVPMVVLIVLAAVGCSSNKTRTAQPALNPLPSVSAGLIAPAPENPEMAWKDDATAASEKYWLASRNDAHVVAENRIPEVADPGSYWIETRDFQRTFNGRPWNTWSSRTWIEQRGSGR